MKKILFYSHFYFPEVGAAAVRMKYFTEALKSLNAEIKIINPVPNYPNGKNFSGVKRFFYKENNITYLPIYIPKIDSPLKRLFSYCSYFFSSLVYSAFSNYKPDVIISSSPPIFTSLAAALLSKFMGAKFILDIRDIWPDIGIELGIIKNKSVVGILFAIEKFILSTAQKVIVTAEGDKQNLENKGIPSDKISIIYNGADTEVFKPINQSEKVLIRNKYKIPIDKKVIIYFGSYNQGMNDIETLGKFLISDRFINRNIHFLSIGSGVNLENLIQMVDGKISYNTIASLPMEEVAKLVAASDISIIPRKNIRNDTGGNIPVKCFESWACGIPVLLSNIEDAEVSDIFKKCESGVLVNPDSIEELVDGLEILLNSNLNEIGKKGRAFVVENFDRKKQSQKLAKIIIL